ncbi:MAG: rare lipoprotein [Actinomycetota bacterium]|jgi:rare lipoprotein A|nr:rare lipoprotein [Actinomycetota bacterium]
MTVALVAVAFAMPGSGASAEPAPRPTAADLPRLQAELAAVTAKAQALADRLEQAAAQDGGLRVAMERLAEQQDLAQARLNSRARLVYMRSRPNPVGALTEGLAAPELRRLAHRGQVAALTVDKSLIDAVAKQSAQVQALQARAAAFRERLRAQAAEVFAAQDKARDLLAVAEELARQQAAAEELARLQAQREQLDDVSRTVTAVLTPAQTRRSRAAAANQAPVLALVEAAGSDYPHGYAPTGVVLRGTASWYGPGFVGSPTASGAPYDPERLTCANKELPLGTVVRVSANGRAVSCLVNDRGPYVGDRILDMSRAGSRALGYDGLASVVIEVLAATG